MPIGAPVGLQTTIADRHSYFAGLVERGNKPTVGVGRRRFACELLHRATERESFASHKQTE
jgi:hypothetical protein